jgi:hypothetical protein
LSISWVVLNARYLPIRASSCCLQISTRAFTICWSSISYIKLNIIIWN